MKFLVALLLLTNTYALTFDLSGTYENNNGCRVFNAYCTNFEGNRCRFEVYIDGEYAGVFGKGGKADIDDEGEVITGKDRGLRSSRIGIPTVANRTAKFTNLELVKDPTTYPDFFVYSFDLEFDGGLFSAPIKCQGLTFTNEY